MTTYEHIKQLRQQMNMSQEELARKTGYTDRSSIAKIEAGKVDLTESKILLFAKALNVSPARLDVDLEKKLIRVREAKESGSSKIKTPKTAAGVRPVPIPDELLPWLQAIQRPSGFVFTQKDGKTPLSETSMRRRWETVKKYMDLELGAKAEKVKLPGQRRRSLVILEHALAEDLDLYDLRHTYCTDLQKHGVPLNVAKILMGHADIATTANIYTHGDDTTVEAARELINKPL